MALFDTSDEENAAEIVEKGVGQNIRCHSDRGRRLFDVRRFTSEQNLLAAVPWYFQPGMTYYVISGGDVDALTFLRHVVRQQPLDYCLVSSWCYGIEDVSEMGRWASSGHVRRFDFYCGEIAKASYALCASELSDIARSTGGRVGVFRNHSKVMAFYGPKFDGVILSSVNVNTNPRTENTVIACVSAVADFFKDFFDGIHPFNAADFPNFQPWRKP